MRTLLIIGLTFSCGCTLLLDRHDDYVAPAQADAGDPSADAGPGGACECGGETPHCVDGACAECASDEHCASDEVCASGACVGACAEPADCGNGFTCDDGRCASCDADGDGFWIDAPGCHSPAPRDCDDANDAVFPGAPVVCGDGVRQDCEADHEVPGGFAEGGRIEPFAYRLPTDPAGGSSVYLRSLEVVPLDDRDVADNPDAAVILLIDGPTGPDAQVLAARLDEGSFADVAVSLSGTLGMHSGVPGVGALTGHDGEVLISVFDGMDMGAAVLDISGWQPGEGPSTIHEVMRSPSFVGEWPDPQMRLVAGPAVAWRECAFEGGSRLYWMNELGQVDQVLLPDAYCGDRTTLAAGGGVVMAESYDGSQPTLAFWSPNGPTATHATSEWMNGLATMVEFPAGDAVALVPTGSGVETYHVACRGGLDPHACVSRVSAATFGAQPWTELRGSVVDGELAAFFGAGPSEEGFMGLALHARFVQRDGRVLAEGGQPVSFPLIDTPEVGQPIGLVERIAATTAPREHGVDVVVAAELEPMVSGGFGPYPREVWVSGVRLCDSL